MSREDIINQSTTSSSSSSSSHLAEDEQRNKLSSQKALQAVTAEKEAALADLNSVERSLSDIFRRYENMKSTLEGFKKVSRRKTSRIDTDVKSSDELTVAQSAASNNYMFI